MLSTSETGTCQRPTAGNVIAFSSFIPHKVKPITSGERYAVVVWFTDSALDDRIQSCHYSHY